MAGNKNFYFLKLEVLKQLSIKTDIYPQIKDI